MADQIVQVVDTIDAVRAMRRTDVVDVVAGGERKAFHLARLSARDAFNAEKAHTDADGDLDFPRYAAAIIATAVRKSNGDALFASGDEAADVLGPDWFFALWDTIGTREGLKRKSDAEKN